MCIVGAGPAGMNALLVASVEGQDAPRMILSAGGTPTLVPGSWIVNCTGFVMSDETLYEPYISAGGRAKLQGRAALRPLPNPVQHQPFVPEAAVESSSTAA